MHIDVRCGAPHGGLVEVRVAGEIDLATADRVVSEVRRAAGTAGARQMRLDLSGTSFLDAAGIAALMRARAAATAAGVPLRVCTAPGHVDWVLRLAGVRELLCGGEPDHRVLPADGADVGTDGGLG